MSDPHYDRFTSHDGTGIAYRVVGSGAPVVLVHGFSVGSEINWATHVDPDEGGIPVAGPGGTVHSALVDAGLQVAMLDLRGHGHSDKPHEPERYSMDACANDVRAFVEHLGVERAVVIGYSMGVMVIGRLLTDPWVSAAVLSGTSSNHVEGQDPDYLADNAILARCFLEGCWNDYPDMKLFRAVARLDPNVDFVALGRVAEAIRSIPPEMLKNVRVPVLVLNGGADEGAVDEYDLSPFIPGARRVIAGTRDHVSAPSDPLFQAELVRFVLDPR